MPVSRAYVCIYVCIKGQGWWWDRALPPGGRRFFDYARNHYGLGKSAQGDENNGSSVVKPGGYGSAYFHSNHPCRLPPAPPRYENRGRSSPTVIGAAVPCCNRSGPDILAAPRPWIPAFAGKTKRGLAGLFSYQSSMPAATGATNHENGSRLRVRVRWLFAPRAPVGIGVAPVFARPHAPGYRPSPVRRCGGCPSYFQRNDRKRARIAKRGRLG